MHAHVVNLREVASDKKQLEGGDWLGYLACLGVLVVVCIQLARAAV